MEVVILVFAVLAATLIFSGLKIVPQAETKVIERLGNYQKTLHPGINYIFPVIDKARTIHWIKDRGRKMTTTRIDLRENIYDFPRQNVITRDNVAIEINAMLYFQVTDPKSAVYEIADLPSAIEKLTQTTLRNIIGELELDATLTSRDTINNKLRVILDEATDKWGVKVNRVELQDIIPPEDIKQAMEKQMRAERDRRAQILEAEGSKRSQILEAEGDKESKINRAEGEKQSAILKAQGEAEARILNAEAEAEAIRRVAEVVSGSGGDPTSYLIALKYLESWKEMVSGKDNKMIYMPYEASGVLSSLAGIKEMFEKNS